MSRAQQPLGTWLDMIPADWQIIPAKAGFIERRQKSRLTDVHLTPSQKYGVLPQSEYMQISGSKVVLNLEGQDNMKHVEANDFIIHLRSFQGGIERSVISGKVSMAYTVLTPRGVMISPTYYRWVLKADAYVQELRSTTDQLRDGQSIKYSTFSKIPLPLPPLDEQRAIADYLNQETAQIDALVAKQEEFIGLLRERRISAVDAILDDLKWVVPLSTQTGLIQTGPFGSQLKSTEYVSQGVPLINPSHIGPDGCLPDPTVSVSKEKAKELSRHALRSGDLIVARRGELARSAVINDIERGFLCGTGSALVRPLPARISADYLNLIYRSRRNSDALSLSSNGSTMESVNAQTIGALRIPVPDLSNQHRIVDQAKHQTARIDTLLAKAEEHIALAKERRSALITAAVTGQFDVRTAKKGVQV